MIRTRLAMAVTVALAAAGLSSARTYTPTRAEPAPFAGSPEADLAAAHCAACHSLDYITTQPRGKGRQFWQDAVTKMINVHGASIPAEEAARIADYLARSR